MPPTGYKPPRTVVGDATCDWDGPPTLARSAAPFGTPRRPRATAPRCTRPLRTG